MSMIHSLNLKHPFHQINFSQGNTQAQFDNLRQVLSRQKPSIFRSEIIWPVLSGQYCLFWPSLSLCNEQLVASPWPGELAKGPSLLPPSSSSSSSSLLP